MDRSRTIVVRKNEAVIPPGPPTPGMDRRQLLEDGNVWAGSVRTDPGLAGGWHHHGDRDSYIYVVSGRIGIDFGPGGREHVDATAGDLIVNPAHLVHRETTPPDEAVEAFVIRFGSGPANVNVDGPEPE